MQNINRLTIPDIKIFPNFNIYVTGGYVRDAILDIESKDIDIACEASSFEEMLEWVEKTHDKVFLINPEFFTIRALYEKGDARDYVLCRKDGKYSDSRHPDTVEAGSIYDDLSRRDFTIGAMAINLKSGSLIDPHGGVADLKRKLLRAVGTAEARFKEDPLRILRAVRFTITKDLVMDEEIASILMDPKWAKEILTVSSERIREEMFKCFKYSTSDTLHFLKNYCSDELVDVLFEQTGVWLKPTLEK